MFRMTLAYSLALLTLLSLSTFAAAQTTQPSPKPMRFLYNSDGNHLFHGERRPADPNEPWAERSKLRHRPLTVDELLAQIDEVADTQIDTFLLCAISYQTVIYKSEIEKRLGDGATDEQLAASSTNIQNTAAALRNFDRLGVDPFKLIVDRVRAKGMRAMATWRMQQAHAVKGKEKSAVTSPFWEQHPELRIKGASGGDEDAALNFASKLVRDRKLALIREFVTRYDLDGVQLDFQRFPLYFSAGKETAGIPLMNELVRDLRAMLDEQGKKVGRTLTLGIRVPETIARCRQLGLDPVTWVNQGWVDFVVVTTFLYQNPAKISIPHFTPEYQAFRDAFTRKIPIMGSIQLAYSLTNKNVRAEFRLEPDDYRREAAAMWRAGLDGIELFNFFMPRAVRDARGDRTEPPLFLLKELGDPNTIGKGTEDAEDAWRKAYPLKPIPSEWRESLTR